MFDADVRPGDAGAQYLRFSTDRSGRTRSNDDQRRDNERDAELVSVPMVKTYAEPARSASRYATKARDEFQRLLRDVANPNRGWNVLWLWESSRGSRQVSEWVALIELAMVHGIRFRITAHRRTYDPRNHRDRRTLQEDAVDSEYESGKTSDRVSRASEASAEAGRPWGKIPYGYLRDYDPRTGALISQRPDPATAPVVEEIVQRVLRGDPISAIVDDLTVRGVPTPTQHRAARMGLPVPEAAWSRSTIHTMFRAPTMVGLRLHRGVVVGSADWEPIVSVKHYDQARARLQSRILRSHPGSAAKHLLSGIARCGVCGASCDRQMNNGVPSYTCRGLPAAHGEQRRSKKHVTRAQAPLDALVVGAVVRRMARPDALELLAADKRDAEATAAAQELAELQATLSVLEDGLRKAPNEHAAKIFQRQVNDLAVRMVELQQQAIPHEIPASVLTLVGPDAAERWDALPLEQQRQVVKALLSVTIHRSSRPRGSKAFDAASVELVWLAG